MRSCVLRLSVIVAVAIGVSAVSARVLSMPWLPDVKAMEEEQQHHEETRATAGVSLDELLAMLDEGAIVVDTRSAEAFEEGHLAAPLTTVMNVPYDDVDAHIGRLLEYAGSRFVLYCTGELCDLAEEVRDAMIAAGFDDADLLIYFGGWDGIVAAGLETAEGPEWSTDGELTEWTP